MGTRPPHRKAKVIRRYVLENLRTRESHAIEADKDIANVDPKDPNANYLALIGITDK
jgi:hypothetical protein